jgi:hypothetical protein
MGLIVSAVFGLIVGLVWYFGHPAIAIGIVAGLLMLTHISVWLK